MKKPSFSGKTVNQAAQPSAPAISEQELERIGKETRSMGTAERVHFWDKQQGRQVWAGADDHILTAEELDADAQAEALERIAGTPRPTLRRHHLVTHPDVILCPNDKSHGKMVINGQGGLLMCGVHKGGAACTGSRPVSL